MRLLIVAATTGYQTRTFADAARRLGVDYALATDRCHILEDPWGDRALPIRFEAPDVSALEGFGGVVGLADRPAYVAALAARRMGIPFHSPESLAAANNKHAARERFAAAGLLTPWHRLIARDEEPRDLPFPCVIKPLSLSASRGVIRADDAAGFRAARDRIAAMVPDATFQVERYIPGDEFALEGVMTHGVLQTLAVFAKPDPLTGPFFEETLYVTIEPPPAIVETTQRAVAALGLSHGPVHAEMRVNAEGVWMLEAAGRPIGGLCAKSLRFGDLGLEELLLRHACGEDVTAFRRDTEPSAVMMIPIPRGGIYAGVTGLEEAQAIADEVIITAKQGQELVPLPEGASYLGFVFARGRAAESRIRAAHAALRFEILATLPLISGR